MKKILILLIAFTFKSGFSQDTANSTLVKYYTEKADKYLDKQKALGSYYSIDKKGISLYADAADKKSQKKEFSIDWDQLNDFRLYYKYYNDLFQFYKKGSIGKFPDQGMQLSPQEKGTKALSGLKIAIDPGHIASDLSTGGLEMKHIKFQKDVVSGLVDSIEFAEGILTYATAKLLKEKLELEGAEVILTRPTGTSAFGKTFSDWKKEDLKKTVDSLFKIGELREDQKNYFLSSKAADRDIFRVLFRDLDLAQRAEIINTFKPDLTIIIHFNVDEKNTNWIKPTSKNFNMAFVGGAFMKSDLASPEKRFEFLRMLITDDLEKSINLSSSVLDSFEKTLNVPVCGEKDATYVSESCLLTEKKGVFCRNLQLTRYVHSPLIYGETLYQDNIKECQLLNKENDKTKNERIQQVAQAYYTGIINYIGSQK
jgi:N-acetylmuramoyl-L-alanine amidase